MTQNENSEPLYVVHTITAGTKHANDLPAPPPGRKLQRIWTLIDKDKLDEMGPVQHQSAFLEDRNHDWVINSKGKLRYFSRVVEADSTVQIVLDYETMPERDERMKTQGLAIAKFDPKTGKRIRP